MSNKYTQIKYVGNEEDNLRRISNFRKRKLLGNESWVLGFLVSFLAVVLPVLFAAIAGVDFWCSLRNLLKSSSISLLCVSTAISILTSYSWNEAFVKDQIILLAFIFTVNMLYGFVSYAEYAEVDVDYYLMIPINIIIVLVMLYIIYNVYRFRTRVGD